MTRMSDGDLVRIRPRFTSTHTMQGRTLLETDLTGMISSADLGLFSYESRLLSLYKYLIDGKAPIMVSSSNVQQHSWLGYYLIDRGGNPDEILARAANTGLEMCISRFVGNGVHEDIDITNYSCAAVRLHLKLEIDGDFADQARKHEVVREI